MADSIRVTANQSAFLVEPGQAVEAVLTVQNLGIAVGVFTIEVEGLNASWYRLSTTQVSLFPGDRATATLTLNPPRDSSARAQTYAFKVIVTSQKEPPEETTLDLTLGIRPFYAFALDLLPQRIKGRKGTHKLNIANTGNVELSFNLAGRDPENLCRFAFDPQTPIVAPGATSEVTVTVQGKRPLRGASKIYRYTLTATPPDGTAQPIVVPGELEAPPRIASWVPVAVGATVVAVVIGVAVWRFFFYEPPVAAKSFEVAPIRVSLTQGETTQLSAFAKDKDGVVLKKYAISWSSKPEGVVGLMSDSGVVAAQLPEGPDSVTLRGIVAGEAVITATLLGQDLPPKSTAVIVLPPVVSTDCIRYDPARLKFGIADGKLALKSGETVVLTLTEDDDQVNAQKLAERHTSRCFIGRGNASIADRTYEVEFWTGSSGIQTTPIEPANCQPYIAGTLQIRPQADGKWLLTEGDSLRLQLDNEQDAQSALTLASRHSRRCSLSGGLTQYWE